MAAREPRALYDAEAGKWQRRQPQSLSDFTGRPPVFSLCGDVQGLDVVDLGCGEGYCSRELATRGAKSVLGIELSEEMVARAAATEAELAQGIVYRQGNVTALDLPDSAFDLATAVFVFNYLSLAETERALAEIHRVLRPGGRLVFSVPHPAFAFIRDEHARPFFFDVEGRDYFSARDHRSAGEIHRRDGVALPVQMVHKTFEDYFDALRTAGFRAMPALRECRVLPEHVEVDRAFFEPLVGVPLHLAIGVER